MRIITVVIAITAGILVLLGYFFPFAPYQDIQVWLLNWAMLMIASAAIVGVLNLVFVHADKIRRREKGNLYSAILIASLFATFLLGLIFSPGQLVMRLLLNSVIFPVEAALLGILTITLLYAAVRLLRRRTDFVAFVFVITAALILFGENIPVIGGLGSLIRQTLAVGGARGILIGVSLGTLLTGLRVLFGFDRPYGGN